MLKKDPLYSSENELDKKSLILSTKVPKQSTLKEITTETAQNIFDTETLRDVLPETRIIEELLVSSVMSPNDTTRDEVTIDAGDRFQLLRETPRLLRVVRTVMKDVYKIEELLPEVIANCLMRKGSHIIAVLPETLIDQQINSGLVVGNESLKECFDSSGNLKPLGFLANKANGSSHDSGSLLAGLEDYFSGVQTTYDPQTDLGTEIIDNFDILKMNALEEKLRTDRTMRILQKHTAIDDRMYAGVESMDEDAPDDETEAEDKVDYENKLIKSFFDSKKYRRSPVQKIEINEDTPAKTTGFGYPVTITLPPESVIPVSVPGDPSKHVLYIVLLDSTSTPIRGFNSPESVAKIVSDFGSDENALLKRLRESAGLDKKKESERNVDDNIHTLEESYRKLINAEVMDRLEAGTYGKDLELGMNEDFYRNMMFQTLRKKKTRMLVLPAELVSYFAFEFNEYGVGKSLMEENRMISIMRSISVFSNSMAAASNSIAEKTIRIQLDPDTPDPEKYIEEAVHNAVVKRRRDYVFSTKPERIVDGLNRAATNVVIEGSEKYPGSMVSMERNVRNSTPVNSEWDEKLRNRFIQGFGLSPEQVDISTSVNYSSQVITSNTLSTKRAIRRQKIIEPQVSEHLRRLIWMSPTIQDYLREIMEDVSNIPLELIRDEYNEDIKKPSKRYIKEFLLSEFIKSVEIKLPRPETEDLQAEREQFSNYMSFIETVVEKAYGSREMFDRNLIGEQYGERWESFIANIKASVGRRYLRDRGLAPEVDEFLVANRTDKIDGLSVEEIVRYMEHMLNSWKLVDKATDKARKDSEKSMENPAPTETPAGTTNTDSVSIDEFSTEGGTDETGTTEETPADENPDDTGAVDAEGDEASAGDEETPEGGADTEPGGDEAGTETP